MKLIDVPSKNNARNNQGWIECKLNMQLPD